ncbi:MAG: LysM peptidoglycan-binding domain-containing protein [Phycisphaeraceae bacterium JB051]
MIDKRLGCLLLGLGVLAGCHPSRSEYIKMPRNPQHAKVQTPVLHPTPAPPRATSPYAPYRQTMPVTTMTTTTQPVQTWQPQVQPQIQPMPIVTQDVNTPIMPTVLSEPVVVTPSQYTVAPVSNSQTKVDFTWIKPADGSSNLSVTTSSTLANTQQPDALVLLPIEQTQMQPQPYQPTSQPKVSTTTTSPILQEIMASSDEIEVQTPLATEHEKQREELLVLLDVDSQDENAALRDDVPDPADDVMAAASDENAQATEQVADEATVAQAPIASESVTIEQTTTPQPVPMDESDRAIAALLATPAPVSQQTLVMAEPELEPVPVPEPVVQTKPDVYQVRKGDTLWSISTRFYGNGQRWLDIARSNGIRHADALRVGQTLKLPD